MFYTLAVVLIVIWLLGWMFDFTGGGLIHVLPLAALLIILAQLFQSRRSPTRKNLKP